MIADDELINAMIRHWDEEIKITSGDDRISAKVTYAALKELLFYREQIKVWRVWFAILLLTISFLTVYIID